ncbi:MAG: AI-2E family transporter, partial [Gammaproteobacteria bacterium]
MELIRGWVKQYFSDPQVIILTLLIIFGIAVVTVAGDFLAPVIASIVIAYLLEPVVQAGARVRIPRGVGTYLVFGGFLLVVIAVVFGLVPLLSRQVTQLFQQVPGMLGQGQESLMALPQRYPTLFTEAQVEQLLGTLRDELALFGQAIVSRSLASVVSVITFMVYLILMPLMVFFFLKDKTTILEWFGGYLPENRALAASVWHDVDRQIGNYIRGKIWEILVVWAASYVFFAWIGLQFSALLAFLVGISVIIPYVGATVVTIPIAVVGFYQWGWSYEFGLLLGGYLAIQALDGNLLVPLLFSEVVNLHPIAIIVAVLFFGGIWGVWGVFFAIPLATLVQAI